MTSQKIKDETNKLIDRCYTKGSPDYPDLMVFQRQKFLNELLPLLDRLGVAVKVDRELPEIDFDDVSDIERTRLMNSVSRHTVDILQKAGLVFTKPLIKEGV